MKRKTFIMNTLLIGILILSACFVADFPKGSSGGNNDDPLGDIIKDICSKNSNAQICRDIKGNEKASLEDVKPILRLNGGKCLWSERPRSVGSRNHNQSK